MISLLKIYPCWLLSSSLMSTNKRCNSGSSNYNVMGILYIVKVSFPLMLSSGVTILLDDLFHFLLSGLG